MEESEESEASGATQTHAELQAGTLRDFRVGLLHGRQQEAEKAAVMDRFRGGEQDVLVCTTVVEVGVDVPNATFLVVEHAERFGLSQLHQLRGRVTRGTSAGQCFLVTDPTSEEARQRLRSFVRTRDGFALAEADVRMRGIGGFFGGTQHGAGELRFGDPVKDADLLALARKDAFDLVAADANLSRPEHALLLSEVMRRYGQNLGLAEVG